MVGLLLEGGKWCWWLSVAHLCLLLLLATFRSLHDLRGPVLVGWVVKKRTNVVHKQGVQQLSDLFLVGEVQSPFKRNPGTLLDTDSWLTDFEPRGSCIPDTLQVHRANLDDVANLLALQNPITSTTGHTGNVEQLGAVNHVVV